LKAQFQPDLLKGVVRVTANGTALALDKEGNVQHRGQPIVAIPYYAWAHRGPGEMLVWLPETETAGRPTPLPTIAMASKVSSSVPKNAEALHDGEVPRDSRDYNPYGDFDWSPRVGTTEWVEYTFPKSSSISSTSVYWVDGDDCPLPRSWRVLYSDGKSWKPVENQGAYELSKDRFNTVRFQPVVTTGLRLEVVLQPDRTAGIHEWKVE
jgi:hypothetical protein